MNPVDIIRAVSNGGKVVELDYPVKIKGFFSSSEISVLTLRRPLAKDLAGIDFTEKNKLQDNTIVLVSRLSGVPVEVIEMLDLSDMGKCGSVIDEMFTGR